MKYNVYLFTAILCLFTYGCDFGSDTRNTESAISEVKLVAEDASTGAEFGKYIAVSGDYVIIAAPGDNTGNGGKGAAYIFRFQENTWIQAAKLNRNDGSSSGFGESVAIDGK